MSPQIIANASHQATLRDAMRVKKDYNSLVRKPSASAPNPMSWL